ncbi:bifunctional Cytochrome c-like domain superfamily/Cytochrome c-like domain [Babesia duncani]|uniref:Bifunctional Cytochrome c-like domain superfamily/Cytochrome c-like domain n=1 Tax=Babesia duncani TaxID=323732 RepID=A0AAD9PKC4_9APIC|nr:bifunctional Cytochrome c-like domain superfamily/Cytochrome c-like domain [Babesia duncani]
MASLGFWDDVTDDFQLPDGDAKRGAKLFKKHCQQCHSLRSDNRPSPAGTWTDGGMNKMSSTLQNSGIIWTEANLMRLFLTYMLLNSTQVHEEP